MHNGLISTLYGSHTSVSFFPDHPVPTLVSKSPQVLLVSRGTEELCLSPYCAPAVTASLCAAFPIHTGGMAVLRFLTV